MEGILCYLLHDLPINDRNNSNAHDLAEDLLKIHKQAHENIVKANARYQHKANRGLKGSKQLQIGDFAWIHLRKERFPQLRKNKLMPRAMGPFQIIDKYGDNAFKMDLLEEFGISSTFNIGDITPYLGDAELWTIPSKEGGNEPIVSKSIEESTEPHEEGRKAKEEEITNASTITATAENRKQSKQTAPENL